VSEIRAIRTNRAGHPCPPWCEADHDKPIGKSGVFVSHHSTEVPPISFPAGYVIASAYQDGFSDAPPQIWIGSLNGPPMFIDPGHAASLAALAEMLAGATPEQHRELAAQIRKAADIAGASGAQS
jgi:hypothetical protein